LFAWETRLKGIAPRPVSGASVHVDWYGWMPDARLNAFRVYSNDSEACYVMLSVTLDEAFGLRESGSLRKSFQIVDVTPALCSRLTDRLLGLLASLDEHAKHYGIIPSIAPLDAANFRSARGQRTARMSSILSRVLLSQRAQFLSKVTCLRDMVSDFGTDFCDAAKDLASGATPDCAPLWLALDQNHYDLNTCFRETMILLKCFLRVLPDDQLPSFQKTVDTRMIARLLKPQRKLIRRRRVPQFAGE
jgi:hypothetical protein